MKGLEMSSPLEQSDPEVFEIIRREEERQQDKLSLIPSENFFSPAVREAVGSVFMHKYAEGNVGKRYYEGCEHVDELEALAIERARQVFRLPDDWDANVQALSGSNANQAVYLATLKPGDTIMGMFLPDGGHLSHGWSYEPKEKVDPRELVYEGGSRRVNIAARLYRTVQYKTDPATARFDWEAVKKIAEKHKPQLLITGGTAYPRDIDYKRVRQIADSVGALYLADIAHEAGLIAAGVLPSPVGIADAVTMTTHKTLRSGRGAVILAPENLIKKVNLAIMPGLQGGPHNHNIAGVCVGLGEALQPEFKVYARQVIGNARALSEALISKGFTLVAGGTDKHLLLVDLNKQPLFGKKFARALNFAGLVANFNTMPQETRSPLDPSAIRLGTPWVTTRGMKEPEMEKIADWMRQVMDIAGKWAELDFGGFNDRAGKDQELAGIAGEVRQLCGQYPLALRVKPSILAI